MSSSNALPRQVELNGCRRFVRSVLHALGENGVADERLEEVLREAVAASCAECGLKLGAKDLILLSASEAPDPNVDAKAHRLWQGYCGRNGCAARYYQFLFNPHPNVDWATILGEAEAAPAEADRAEAVVVDTPELAAARARRRKLTYRTLIVAGLVLTLFLVRHWRSGGTIPFLREPTPYRVDPSSVPLNPGR